MKTRIFRGIGNLYDLKEVAVKKGRHVIHSDLGKVSKAAMIEQKGKIAWVGAESKIPRAILKALKNVHEVDLEGATVVPGFIECHTHLVFAGSRAGEFERRLNGESYQSIAQSGGGILSTVSATGKAKPKDLLALSQSRVQRFIDQGVTTIEVKSGYGLSSEGELKMLRVAKELKRARIVPTFLGAHAIPKGIGESERYLDMLINEVLPRVAKEGLSNRVDIFIEKGFFSLTEGQRYLQKAQAMGFDLVIHADQLSRTGSGSLAAQLGARSADHLIEINKKDINQLARSQTVAVLLPSADLYMQCRYPPARKLIDAGACVALATDYNPGSSPSQDLALVGVLARLEMKMKLPEVISAYTIGAATALGLEKKIGSLEKGKECDFAVLMGDIEDLFLDVGQMPVDAVYRSGRKISQKKM